MHYKHSVIVIIIIWKLVPILVLNIKVWPWVWFYFFEVIIKNKVNILKVQIKYKIVLSVKTLLSLLIVPDTIFLKSWLLSKATERWNTWEMGHFLERGSWGQLMWPLEVPLSLCRQWLALGSCCSFRYGKMQAGPEPPGND